MLVWMISLMAGASAGLLADVGGSIWSSSRRRKRLRVVNDAVPGASPSFRTRVFDWMLSDLLPVLGGWQSGRLPSAWRDRLRRDLSVSPVWRHREPAQWVALQEIAAAAGMLGGFVLSGDIVIALALGAAGFFLPALWLKEQKTSRARAVVNALPETLDLMASCMEAGLGFEAALLVLLERSRRGVLAEELSETMRQIRMGRSRRDALRALADRVAVTDLSAFVAAVIQAERLGVSVAGALKTQAGQLRAQKSQRVEKSALEAPIKLLFPLVVFIFPVVFLILFGPIVLKFLELF